MIDDCRISDASVHRQALLDRLRTLKQSNPSFTVIDVGGSLGGWSAPVVDVIADMNEPSSSSPISFFKVNLNDQNSWDVLLDHVAVHGKFSYAICSHTLEDICNPALTLQMLPRIALAGSISVPSKYREFSRIEGPYLGYIHHRWIYDVRNGVFIGYPKLGFLEYFNDLHRLANKNNDVSQLAFEWKDTIPYQFVNNDYLGPDVASVYRYYLRLLD